MHESENRLLCRLTFVICCIVPTVVVAYWTIKPVSITSWQSRLSSTFGSDVTVDSVTSIRPNVVSFENVSVDDHYHGQLAQLSDMLISYNRELECRVSSCELRAESLKAFVGSVHSAFQHEVDQNKCRMNIGELTFWGRPFGEKKIRQKWILKNVQISMRKMESAVEISMTSEDAQNKMQFRLSSKTTGKAENLKTEIEFETFGNNIPTWCLQEYEPLLEAFGYHSDFVGGIKCVIHKDVTQVSLTPKSKFRFVDLVEFVKSVSPCEILGESFADLKFSRGVIRDGKIVALDFQIDSNTTKPNGEPSAFLTGTTLKNAEQFGLITWRAELDDNIAFRKIRAQVVIEQGKDMQLIGICDQNGTIVEYDNGAMQQIIQAKIRTQFPISKLYSAIVPNGLQSSLSKEYSRELIRMLPDPNY